MTAYLPLWCRALLAGVFLLAVAGKVWRRSAFREFSSAVAALGVVPASRARSLAYGVVAAEAVAVALLAAPPTAPFGLAYAAVLLAVFVAGIAVGSRRPGRLTCACFGRSSTPLGLPHIVRNLALVAVCGIGLAATAAGTTAGSGPRLEPGATALVLTTAAVAALLVAYVADLGHWLVGAATARIGVPRRPGPPRGPGRRRSTVDQPRDRGQLSSGW